MRPALESLEGRVSDVALAATLPLFAVEVALRLVARELARSLQPATARTPIPQPN
jgi:hypothetical protein